MRPSFAAHNFELADGTWTLPGAPPIGTEAISAGYLRTFLELCPPPARVADLGCLEGGYSVLLANAGYEVLGIEGQPDNFATCEWVAAVMQIDNLRFVEDDVREIRRHGEFDAVLCAGLLYHLDRPVEYLRTLGDVTRRLLVVSANHATRGGRELERYAPTLSSELTSHEGKLGRWFGETPGPWSALGNSRSFWLERDDLARAIAEAGFTAVSEQLDWLADPDATRRMKEAMISIFVGLRPG